MAWSVQQKGEGTPRDLIIIGHGGLTAAITAAAPRACVVGVTFPALAGGYAQIAPDKLPPLAEIVRGALGSTPLGSLVLVGFSEGCQLVRTYLAAGEVPSAVLVIDGAHGSKPEPSAAQLAPWRSFFGRARAGQRHAMITATRIPTANYLPTAYMLPLIMGCPPPPLEAADLARLQAARPLAPVELQAIAAGALRPGRAPGAVALLLELAQQWRPRRIVAGAEGDIWEKGPGYWYTRDALAYAEQWPGTDAAAHIQQAKEVLPRLLGRVMAALSDLPMPGWVKGVSEGAPPPPPAGVVWPTVPGNPSRPPPPASTPPSSPPASGPPGGRPPSGPPSSSPPASRPPPPKDDGSGGAAALLLVLTAGGVGLLTLKRLPAGAP